MLTWAYRQSCRSRSNRWGIASIALSALGLLIVPAAYPAYGDVERFPYTYGWQTSPKGEVEVELSHIQPANGRTWQDALSAEIGITDRYMIEPYLVYNRSGGFRDIPASQETGDADDGGGGGSGGATAIFDPIRNGGAYRYGGFRLEQRYRFGDYGFNKPLFAGYLEYEQVRPGKPSLESKLIVQYDPIRPVTLALNLIEESGLHNGRPQWSYSFGGAYLADQKNDRYWVGAEAFGNWSSTQHWIGPSAGVAFDSQTRLIGTYGKQYIGGGGDQLKVVLSREFD